MINNRQGGRRRGRGGQRGPNLGGQPGNRQDNRQRGNAAQLLEKYKSMARDSQLAGDRVQTEYYLQFADHYFRVLSESRARFEDQNPSRRQRDDDDGDDGEDELEAAEADGSDEQPEREERHDRGERHSRGNPRPRREERSARDDRDDQEHVNGAETIPFDALPPAIGRDEPEAEGEPKRPKRRTRAPRSSGNDEDVAPAA